MGEIEPRPDTNTRAAETELEEALAELQRRVEAAEGAIDELTAQVVQGATERQRQVSTAVAAAAAEFEHLSPGGARAVEIDWAERVHDEQSAVLAQDLPPPDEVGRRRIPWVRITFFLVLLAFAALAAALALGSR